jgi:hypothetical protein
MSTRVINSMGMGQITMPPGSSETYASEGYPGYCSWMPFADFFSECQVPTAQAILTANLTNYGAAATPATIAAGQEAAAQSIAADCTNNPEACSEFTFAGNSPTIAAMFGAGAVGQAVGGASGLFSTSTWVWVAVAGLAAYVLFFNTAPYRRGSR